MDITVTTAQATNQLREFIGAIFEPDDIVEVQLIHKPTGEVSQHWHLASDIVKYVDDIQQYNDRGFDVYIGINPRKAKGTPGVVAKTCTPEERCGGCNSCAAIARCLFVDFDNDTTPFEATTRIDEAGLPQATMLIQSGHGVHGYWRLDLPMPNLGEWANEDSPIKARSPVVKPAPNKSSTTELATLPLTDTGNAERLVARHGADLRFSQALGWLCWDGRRWKRDDTGEAERRAKRTVRELYNEAASIDDADKRGKLLAWAKASESARYRHNLLDLAKSEAVVVVTPDQLDQDDFLLNVTNGTVNLRTGELQPHDRTDLITKLAPVEYDPDAMCPTFDRFLDETVCQRKDLSRYLKQTFGMYLTGDISEQILLIGIGTGSNGKNTLIDQMTAIWGDYASEAAPGLLVAQKHQQHPTEIADLLGKRLIIASETERNEHLRVQFVKRITGDARLKGRFMHKDFFEFRRTVKVVLITNNKPVISERTHAIWRRLRLVPFDNVVADQDQDKSLPEKLRAESSGIFAWLVQGCLEWQKVGLVTPQAVLVATDEYQTDSDWLERFVEQCLMFDPEQWTASARLTDVLTNWCREVGAQADIPGMHERLRQEGCEPKKNEHRRGWQGVGVSTIDEVRTT